MVAKVSSEKRMRINAGVRRPMSRGERKRAGKPPPDGVQQFADHGNVAGSRSEPNFRLNPISLFMTADTASFLRIECGVIPSGSLRVLLGQSPVIISNEVIGFALLDPISGIAQAVQECSQPDPRACYPFLQACAPILRESGRCVCGFIQQTETPP